MKLKKIIFILITFLILCIIGIGTYTLFFKEDKNNTLTVIEKQWIEDNKNNIIDLGVVNNIPIFNYNGEGVIFDFISDIEKNTGLEFNKISYSYDKEVENEYTFAFTDTAKSNDIIIYSDNYALISNVNERYNNLNDLKDTTLGILEDDKNIINNYLSGSINIKTYKDMEQLLKAIKDEEINGAIILKTVYLDDIIENDLYINYNLSEIEKHLVFRLGKTNKLNVIIKKYYEKWYKEKYIESYSNHFSNYYYEINNISDDDKVNFKSKLYKYGFIENAPYDKLSDGKLIGINNEIIADFAALSDIEIKYYKYNKNKDLINNFNSNKIDFYFNMYDNDKFDMDVVKTVSFFKEDIVVLSSVNNRVEISSLQALYNKKIMTIENTKISHLLDLKKIEYKKYKNNEELLNNINDDYLIIMNKETYNTYKSNLLENYIDVYSFELEDDYNYIIRDIKDNKIFIDYFNFYLSFINYNYISKNINYNSYLAKNDIAILEYVIIGAILIASIFLIILIIKKGNKNKKRKNQVSKENRIKYIDMLTSLKNRNYLNDSIEKWDESEIYPQAIIIVDLNNIAYINDNYGHAEGDNVIKEAANILFKNQVENSEIMRTNGNEFLIYMVQYEEKQVVSYIRKLNREFKELSHSFGAAIGYSMITDGLKTIDDAINEATLDMKTNKEEAR